MRLERPVPEVLHRACLRRIRGRTGYLLQRRKAVTRIPTASSGVSKHSNSSAKRSERRASRRSSRSIPRERFSVRSWISRMVISSQRSERRIGHLRVGSTRWGAIRDRPVRMTTTPPSPHPRRHGDYLDYEESAARRSRGTRASGAPPSPHSEGSVRFLPLRAAWARTRRYPAAVRRHRHWRTRRLPQVSGLALSPRFRRRESTSDQACRRPLIGGFS